MRNEIAPGGFVQNHFSQEPGMPFPINPLALVDKPSVLGAPWGNPRVYLQGLKKTKSHANNM